jgi:hypothetical protein
MPPAPPVYDASCARPFVPFMAPLGAMREAQPSLRPTGFKPRLLLQRPERHS